MQRSIIPLRERAFQKSRAKGTSNCKKSYHLTFHGELWDRKRRKFSDDLLLWCGLSTSFSFLVPSLLLHGDGVFQLKFYVFFYLRAQKELEKLLQLHIDQKLDAWSIGEGFKSILDCLSRFFNVFISKNWSVPRWSSSGVFLSSHFGTLTSRLKMDRSRSSDKVTSSFDHQSKVE